MNLQDIYQSVTNTIIQLLEDHQESWNRPWVAFGQDGDFAKNALTGRYYRGINQLLLSIGIMQLGYFKNTWLTFNQVKEQGGFVLKGEKSLPVIFYKSAYIDDNKKYYDPEIVRQMKVDEWQSKGIKSVPILKLFHVFNVAQTQGLDPAFYEVIPQEPLKDFEKDLRAENLILSTGANVEIKESNRAYYDIAADKIVLPLREQFRGQSEPFYATALHELGHWTGGTTRLNRTFGKEFGDKAYAMEELVAELSSAFCCAHLGFSKTISSNASYIKGWLGVMKENDKAVIKASYQAQKAADYIIGGEEFAAYASGE